MEKVKDFIERFFKDEVEVFFQQKIPDLETYNNAVRTLYTYTVGSLNGSLSVMVRSKLRNDRFYKRNQNPTRDNPRHLYKISHYKHSKYGNVWVAYCSQKNPSDTYKAFSDAFFVIEEKDGLRIAKKYDYSHYESEGREYKWEDVGGYNDLTFGSLGELVKIERFLEPENEEEYMKMYLEEK